MKPVLFFLAVFALLTLCLTCASNAADASPPPLVVEWTLDASPPAILAACPGGQCAAPARVGRVATAPVRAVLAVRPVKRVAGAITAVRPLQRAAGVMRATRPLQRVGSAIREVRPVRRIAIIGAAPVRWLSRR